MNLIIAIETLLIGGAETFVLRLANNLSKEDRIIIFIYYGDKINQNLLNIINNNIIIVPYNPPCSFLFDFLDRILNKLKIDFSFRFLFAKRKLKQLYQEYNISTIHSHLFKIDYLISKTFSKDSINIISTIHGDYLKFYNKPDSIFNFNKKLATVLNRINHFVCISDKQIDFVKEKLKLNPSEYSKIYNGYSIDQLSNNDLRKKNNIDSNAFVFGMLSRGIPDKGWQFAIDAFKQLNHQNTYLVLVGDGNYLLDLKSKYRGDNSIIFAGATTTPLEWIKIFDVGLLPSIYGSESLPTALIEYMALGKPTIASDAGEIFNMLNTNEGLAGMITPIKNNKVNIQDLSNCMDRYLKDKTTYLQHSQNAQIAFKKFNMANCISKYYTLYRS